MAESIFSRKLDLAYLIFFLIHIPIMLVVDLTPIYPKIILENLPFLHEIRKWYIATYNDPLFTNPPAWFAFFTWMEAVLHMPTSLWAIPALLRDDPRVPLVLLVFGAQTALTTGTCVAEVAGRAGVSDDQLRGLLGLYVPYAAFGTLMFLDTYLRLSNKLVGQSVKKPKKA